ncbi:MAG TPA: DegV family protein [Acidimicrobiales bacterium]|nr:DegV family protein [Acidimicrobiales bacterium]
MTVRIVTDSACDLTDDEVAKWGVEIVSLTIRFGDEEFVDRTELPVSEFYRRLASSAELPQTAAPAPGAFAQAYERLHADGATAIVCINLSSELSATMQSAQTAATAFTGIPVHVVDSRSITGGLGQLVICAAGLARDGADAETIVNEVDALKARQRIYGTLDTLEYLKKGGRIGGAQALLGSMLSIKPLLDISNGSVEEAGKTRTRKKALQWLRDQVMRHYPVDNLNVIHSEAPDIDDFLQLLRADIDMTDVRVGPIGAVIGSHGGPRVVGVTFHVR